MSLPERVPTTLPEERTDRDLNVLLRGVQQEKDWGVVEEDPDEVEDGQVWTRGDLSPPERRFRIDGATYKIQMTAV